MNTAPTNQIRVAALQFEVTEDAESNLATCLRMLDAIAGFQPALIVLPALNHSAAGSDAAFVQAIAAKAAEHRCTIVFRATLPDASGSATDANVVCDAQGEAMVVGESGPVVSIPAAQVGVLAGAEEMWREAGRALAENGAQILAVSLRAKAEEVGAQLRACARQHGVFVIAANRIEPAESSAPAQDELSSSTQPQQASATGIIAPNGKLLAGAPREGMALVIIDLDLALAKSE